MATPPPPPPPPPPYASYYNYNNGLYTGEGEPQPSSSTWDNLVRGTQAAASLGNTTQQQQQTTLQRQFAETPAAEALSRRWGAQPPPPISTTRTPRRNLLFESVESANAVSGLPPPLPTTSADQATPWLAARMQRMSVARTSRHGEDREDLSLPPEVFGPRTVPLPPPRSVADYRGAPLPPPPMITTAQTPATAQPLSPAPPASTAMQVQSQPAASMQTQWKGLAQAALRAAVSEYPVEAWRSLVGRSTDEQHVHSSHASGASAGTSMSREIVPLEVEGAPTPMQAPTPPHVSLPPLPSQQQPPTNPQVPAQAGEDSTWRSLRRRIDDAPAGEEEELRSALHVWDHRYFRDGTERMQVYAYLTAMQVSTAASPSSPRNTDHTPWFACSYCGAAMATYAFLAGVSSAAADGDGDGDGDGDAAVSRPSKLLWRWLSGRTHKPGVHAFPGSALLDLGAIHFPEMEADGGRWFAHVFVHSSLMQLVVNCALLLAISASVERRYGTTRFALLCFVTSVGTAFFYACFSSTCLLRYGGDAMILGTLPLFAFDYMVHFSNISQPVVRLFAVFALVVTHVVSGLVHKSTDHIGNLIGVAVGLLPGALCVARYRYRGSGSEARIVAFVAALLFTCFFICPIYVYDARLGGSIATACPPLLPPLTAPPPRIVPAAAASSLPPPCVYSPAPPLTQSPPAPLLTQAPLPPPPPPPSPPPPP